MDADTPVPSIEQADRDVGPPTPHVQRTLPETTNHFATNTPAATPAPSSASLRSPRNTPRLERYVTSPSLEDGRSSTVPGSTYTRSHERQSTPPMLQTRRSSAGLRDTPPWQPSVRRSYANLNSMSLSPAAGPMVQERSKKAPMTAASVAREYFRQELDSHATAESHAQTVIIVHDACYGHRFSRPRTSKAALNTIVERPERMLQTVLGVSAAYVRLGQRHADGRHPPHPDRNADTSPPPSPFEIRKTSRCVALTDPSVTHVHGVKWMEELQKMCESAEGKLALNGRELVRPTGYGKDEDGTALPKLHEGDLYLCAESLHALQGCLGGVCEAVDTVLNSHHTKRAFVCIRPPGHHCSANYPSGFCWLNNVHVGIAHAAMQHRLTHAAIIDFDLHHGDGSQKIAWDHNQTAQSLGKNAPPFKKTPIGYFSLHDINSYPCEMGDEDKVRNASVCIEHAHGQSIWNVHLEPWTTLDEFWMLYESRYRILLDKTRSFLRRHAQRLNSAAHEPVAKAAIFISAGFDASEWEGAGMQRHKVNVPTDFYARFTADIVKLAHEEDLGVDGRVISVLEGGYSDRALTSGVLSHLCGLARQTDDAHGPAYNRQWWSLSNLEELEFHVNGGRVNAAAVTKDKLPGNYTSPTHASTAKMSETARERRSLSSQLEHREAEAPPAPAVDWATAAYELSRLIIPGDRPTTSCRHEELNAEATKARRDRQSTMGLPLPLEEKPMQLRDRRAKAVPLEAGGGRPSSRSDGRRRTTIAAVTDLPDPTMKSDAPTGSSRPRRRSSAASSIISNMQEMQITDELTKESRSSPSASTLPDTKAAVVKKTRGVGNVKPQPKNSTVTQNDPRQHPPAPRIPPGGRKVEPNAKELANHQARPSTATVGTNPVSDVDGVDSLANGVKKMSIKLKVPTPEEHAAREKAAKATKPRAPRKPTAPKGPKASSAPKVKPSVVAVTLGATANADPDVALLPGPSLPAPTVSGDLPMTDATPYVPPQPLQEEEFTNGRSVNTATSSAPDPSWTASGPDRDVIMSEASHVSGTPDVKRMKAELPVFTSSSPIPFSRPVNPNDKEHITHPQTMNGPEPIAAAAVHPPSAPSIWDIPETPQR